MLEKLVGNVNAQKPKAILLLKACFSAAYKIFFSNRPISELEAADAIPTKVIGSRRTQEDTCLALNRKLVDSIDNARKLPMITICADAANCYNRVAYPFARTHT